METIKEMWEKARVEQDVFLFVPNLIGYARVIFAILSFYTMPSWPTITFIFYFLSTILDAFDGLAARALNQSSKFGALLDQLTDRCGTMCLLLCLGHFYPSYLFWFQLSAFIDIFSHWMHTQVSLMSGKNHKMIAGDQNAWLRMYYTNKLILFALCAANETFYVSLYMVYFYEGPTVLFSIGLFRFLVIITLPFALIKAAISVIQLLEAANNCKELDMADREQYSLKDKNKRN